MDLFINIHDKEKDIDMLVNVSTIESYAPKIIKDRKNQDHICILYIFTNGIRTIEEFDSISERDNKINELEEYLA